LCSHSANLVVGLVRNKAAVDAKLAGDKISNVQIMDADLTDYNALYRAAEETSKFIGGSLDYLIVNGAYTSPDTAPIAPSQYVGKEDYLKSELTTSFLTNVLGPLYTINAFLPLIRKGAAKKIVVISSGLSDPEFAQICGLPGSVPYTYGAAPPPRRKPTTYFVYS
jgi:NAD(P)-dependent dehydrogenase (short-subunit alcohol dehydrogenase family)